MADSATELLEAKLAFDKAKYYKNSDPRKTLAKEALIRAKARPKESQNAEHPVAIVEPIVSKATPEGPPGVDAAPSPYVEKTAIDPSLDNPVVYKETPQGPLEVVHAILQSQGTPPDAEPEEMVIDPRLDDPLVSKETPEGPLEVVNAVPASEGTPLNAEPENMVIDPRLVNQANETPERPSEVVDADHANTSIEVDNKSSTDGVPISKILSADEGEHDVLQDSKRVIEPDGLISFTGESCNKRESPEPEPMSRAVNPQSLKLALAEAMEMLESPDVQSVAKAMMFLRQITTGPGNEVEHPETKTDDEDEGDSDSDRTEAETELKNLSTELRELKKTMVGISKNINHLQGETKAVVLKELENKKALSIEIETRIEEMKARSKKTSARPLKRKKRATIDDEDIPAGADKWYRLNDDDKLKFEEEAKDAFKKYRRTKNDGHFGPSYRRAALTVSKLLPEAATTSREAALMVHMNSFLNLVCRYHMSDKKYPNDGMIVSDNKIHGVGYKGKYGTKQAPVIPQPNHMNCGCLINDVLLEFLLWKTFTIRSSNPRVMDGDGMPRVEGLGSEIFHPRKRAFHVQAFQQFTGLTVDDLYTEGSITDGEYIMRLRLIQATRCTLELQKMGVHAVLNVTPPNAEQLEDESN